jgi:hypothetical protein
LQRDFETKKRMDSEGIIRAQIIDPLTATARATTTVNGVTKENITERTTSGVANIVQILQPGLDLIAPFLPEVESKIADMTDVQIQAEVDNVRPNNQWYVISLNEMGKRTTAKERAERQDRDRERIDTERRHREQIDVAKEQSSSAKNLAKIAIWIAAVAAVGTILQAYYARVAILDARSTANKAAATPPRLAQPESRPASASAQQVKAVTPAKAQSPSPTVPPKPAATP